MSENYISKIKNQLDTPIKKVWKEIQTEFHNFKVIENLGMKFTTEKSKNKKRFVKVQCIKCNAIYDGAYALFKNKEKVCKCSVRTRPKIKSEEWTRLQKIRHGMIRRCYNKTFKSYKDYGFRGIIVCNEWLNDFNSFYRWSMENGYTGLLTIDRIDNDKGYSPDNCRWITKRENCRNKKYIIGIDKVREIKKLLLYGYGHKEIAAIVDTTIVRVQGISRKSSWIDIE